MKHYLITLGIALSCLVSSCGSKDTAAPETKPDDTTKEPDKPVEQNSVLVRDVSFNAPTGFSSANAAVQPDGKIVIDSYATANNVTTAKILRLNANGTQDNSFNIDVDRTWVINAVSGIFILADGKILLGGSFTVSGQAVFFVRLTATGALDRSYVPPFINPPSKILFQRAAEGKLLVSFMTRNNNAQQDMKANLIRLNNDGSQDAGFTVPIYDLSGQNDDFMCIVPLVNGQIIVSGLFSIGDNTTKRQNVARLNSNGSVDFTFNFKENLNNPVGIQRIVVQNGGKIIIAGAFSSLTDPNVRDAVFNYVGIARLNGTDGSIDASFKALTTLSFSNYVSDIALLSDNRLLLNWKGVTSNDYYNKNFVELIANDGGIDRSYAFPYQYSKVYSILKEATDQFLVMGEIAVNNTTTPIIRLKKP